MIRHLYPTVNDADQVHGLLTNTTYPLLQGYDFSVRLSEARVRLSISPPLILQTNFELMREGISACRGPEYIRTRTT